MSPFMRGLTGADIERKSMELIERELGPTSFSPNELDVLKRIIHATADFDFAKNIRFHEDAVDAGIDAIRKGSPIITDTQMAVAGISKRLLPVKDTMVMSPMGTDECRRLAGQMGGTQAEAAMEIASRLDPGIVAIGNAPTALIRLLDMVRDGRIRPRLIIGVPVGFVNAKESKDALLDSPVPFITTLGRKGGTPVAVAAVNAIIRLAI